MSQRDRLLKKLAQEKLSALEDYSPPDVLSEAFDKQLEFIKDTSRRKIACLTRRSGKSTTVGLYLLHQALHNPGSKSIYVNLTKDSAKKVMWHDIFETIILKLKVPAELVGLEIRFENGSIIYLAGTDSSAKEKHKLRGQKNIIAVIDECQSFTTDLKELVESVIMPTLADYDGTLCMIGTPGNSMGEHYWWQLNKPDTKYQGWKHFHWDWNDNPFVKTNMRKQVDELVSNNPLIKQTPTFRQEYMGEWVIEANARVYKSDQNNYINELPKKFLDGGASYVLSFDLGWNDATTFVVSVYNPFINGNLYILESARFKELNFSEVASKIKEYQKRFDFANIVGDAANKQGIQEMVQIHGLPIQAAQKLGKESHIGILNSDFITRNVLILKQTNQDLIRELEILLWDAKSLLQGNYIENQSQPNDLCDALLYNHHFSRHWWFQPVPDPMTPQEKQTKRIMDLYGKEPEQDAFETPFWQRPGFNNDFNGY